MKKNIVKSTIGIILIMFLLEGCKWNDSKLSESQELLLQSEIGYSTIFGEEDFISQIQSNPIDSKMQSSAKLISGDSGDLISVTAEYYQDWKMQLEKTIFDFQRFLDQTEYQHLLSSYYEWNEHLTNIDVFEKSIFYANKYSDNIGGTGSLHKLLLLTQKVDRTKEYCLYIMELYYLFTNKVEWIATD